MNNVVLLLGTNVGDRPGNLKKALQEINIMLGQTIQQSSVYETAPWGNTEQEIFLNRVVIIQSEINAEEMMDRILRIENEMGRVRTMKWEPRIMDIDILFFNNEIILTKNLIVPHPNLHERKFTLMPLAELMPDFVHPVLKKTIAEILLDLDDNLEVTKTSYNLA